MSLKGARERFLRVTVDLLHPLVQKARLAVASAMTMTMTMSTLTIFLPLSRATKTQLCTNLLEYLFAHGLGSSRMAMEPSNVNAMRDHWRLDVTSIEDGGRQGIILITREKSQHTTNFGIRVIQK
jgi:hypothetical protein